VQAVPVDAFRPSPFQPSGRPSTAALEAVRRAIAQAGSVERLVSEAGTPLLTALDPEARDLAELTADVSTHGVESPLEARRTPAGLELLAGHRRLAAAQLAGIAEVAVRVFDGVPDHEAAMIVFRRNRLRADFTPWQEATSLLQLRERRREQGLGEDSLRSLALLMGYSIGRASELLGMARAFPPEVLAPLSARLGGDAAEALSRVSYRTLRALTRIEDPERRIVATLEVLGVPRQNRDLSSAAGPLPRLRQHAFRTDARRSGGFTITIFKPLHQMTDDEATPLLRVLEESVRALRHRHQSG
jgi:ParB family chromosome partitioning protein